MSQILGLLGVVCGLVSLGCFIFVVVKMFQNGKTGPAIGSLVGLLACGLGLLFAFIYGWTKAGEWGIKNVMMAWTAAFLLSLGINVATLPAQMEAIKKAQEQMQQQNQGAPIGIPAPAPVAPANP